MGYKICSNIPCLSRRCYGKYWRRPSLLINLFNITHLKNWTDVFEIPYNSNIRKLWIKCLTVFYLALWIWGQTNNMFYGLSAFFNQLVPVNFIFLYFLAEIHEFSFAPRCKMDGHRGTCTWCFKINCINYSGFPHSQQLSNITSLHRKRFWYRPRNIAMSQTWLLQQGKHLCRRLLSLQLY